MSSSTKDSQERGVYAQLEQNQNDLEQNLVGPAPDTVLPVSTAKPMMEVTAPATLQENYTFEAEVNGRTVSVKVPPGGVEEGQKFMVPLETTAVDDTRSSSTSIPVGHWRDGLCQCFQYGPCHNHMWCSFLCPLPAIGQVITRLQLNWLGLPGSVAESAAAFRILVSLMLAYLGLYYLCNAFIGDYGSSQQQTASPTTAVSVVMILQVILHYTYFFFTVYLVWRVRKYVRGKYAIPEAENCPGGLEDVTCAVCCHCCVTAQLLRHTADYDTYASTCCTDTGLPSHVESIV